MKGTKKYKNSTVVFLSLVVMLLHFTQLNAQTTPCPAKILVTAPVVTPATCNNLNGSVLADITTMGGTPPYQLSLNGQGNTSGNFIGLGAGQYMLRVTDGQGCTDSLFVTIASTGGITSPSISTFEPSSCNGIDGIVKVLNIQGPSPYSYTLNGITNTTGTFPGLGIGTYSMTITDANGCKFTANDLTVKNKIVSGGSCNAGDDATIFEGESAFINGTADGTVLWEPSNFLTDTNKATTTAIPPPGIHTYTMHSINVANCTECTDEVTITVIPELFIPNTFTPNGDGDNDVWAIRGLSTFDDCELWIYTRWGERVLHQTGYEDGEEWNGTNHGLQLPAATYYYVIDIKKKDSAGKPKKYAGSITIVK